MSSCNMATYCKLGYYLILVIYYNNIIYYTYVQTYPYNNYTGTYNSGSCNGGNCTTQVGTITNCSLTLYLPAILFSKMSRRIYYYYCCDWSSLRNTMRCSVLYRDSRIVFQYSYRYNIIIVVLAVACRDDRGTYHVRITIYYNTILWYNRVVFRKREKSATLFGIFFFIG